MGFDGSVRAVFAVRFAYLVAPRVQGFFGLDFGEAAWRVVASREDLPRRRDWKAAYGALM